MIITIARECGCYGDGIGAELAKRLGVLLFDKKKILELAKEKGVYDQFPFFYKERQSNMLLSSIVEEEQLGIARQTPRKALDAVVGDHSCVILGRCGGYAYEGEPHVVRVFLSGKRENRITHLMEKHRVSRNEAIATMDQTDNRRRTYYRYYTGQEWGYANNYDLCINVSDLGIGGTVEMIIHYIEQYKE